MCLPSVDEHLILAYPYFPYSSDAGSKYLEGKNKILSLFFFFFYSYSE